MSLANWAAIWTGHCDNSGISCKAHTPQIIKPQIIKCNKCINKCNLAITMEWRKQHN